MFLQKFLKNKNNDLKKDFINMALLTYSSFILISILSIVGNFKNKYLSGILAFLGILIWSIMARLLPINEDFEYYFYMMEQKELIVVLASNLTEPILYTFQWVINRQLNNTYLTFLVTDVILLSILFKSLSGLASLITGKLANYKLKRFYLPIFFMLLLSWPFYLGFHVTYRQFSATIIFLYALGKLQKTPLKAIFIYAVSVLIHNSLFLFAPVIGFLLRGKFLSSISILFSLAMPVFLIFISSTRASRDVGVVLASLYPITIFILCLVVTTLALGQNKKIGRNFQILLLYIPYISIHAWLFLGNGQAERFGLLSFSILLPTLMIFLSDKFKNKYIIYSCILAFILLPMITFYQGMLLL
jgi:hypothetical protein